MLRRYRKIEVDSRFSAAEDRGQYSGCGDDAAKLMSSNFFYLLLSPSIYKASGACESRILYYIGAATPLPCRGGVGGGVSILR